MDIVDIFENHANTLGYRFSYGNRANQNLLQSDGLNENTVYMLLDPVRRTRLFSEFGGTGNRTYNGQFLLLVKSNLDNTYHNQSEGEEQFTNRMMSSGGVVRPNTCSTFKEFLSKYRKNIYPLLEEDLTALENLINCSEYNIESWEMIDAVNIMDVNYDGLVVTFTISVLE